MTWIIVLIVSFSAHAQEIKRDVVLIGGGIMSATLATFLNELSPDLNVEIIEKQSQVAKESSNPWNNAGTGHQALCELNYTPELSDGTIDITKALKINESFEISKQFWSYLVEKSYFHAPEEFIHSVPHISMVKGERNIEYLRKRREALIQSPLFSGLELASEPETLKQWMPLVMQGKNLEIPIAASRSDLGTDVNFGKITENLFEYLKAHSRSTVTLGYEVTQILQGKNGTWHIVAHNKIDGVTKRIETKIVFIGAGGGAYPLLKKTRIPESNHYALFPIGGQFLVSRNPELIRHHETKIYGMAEIGAPPMSVPHLDLRYIDGEKLLLFGPFAKITSRFQKQGSPFDLFRSIDSKTLGPLLSVASHNTALLRLMTKQALIGPKGRLKELRKFIPNAESKDWTLVNAGIRAQIIKKKSKHSRAQLEFGTEVVSSQDGTLTALLGASPGASTSVSIILDVLSKSFPSEINSPAWLHKLKAMIPSYGESLARDADLLMRTRSHSHQVLHLKSID